MKYQLNGKGGTHSPPVMPQHLQCSTPCEILNGHQGALKWLMGLEKGENGLWPITEPPIARASKKIKLNKVNVIE